jgi:hypothetical protein
MENVSMPLANISETGVFSIGQPYNKNDSEGRQLFGEQLIICWRQHGNAMFALAADLLDNLQLATQFLQNFPSFIDEHYRKPAISTQPKEV